ncbi:hypothetical protein [Oscillibacter sp. 1-3]|uniref:hypothetical protein n=1 Tax=Oscillibacter sp. 1-3 TaxID=1235797 RepID=UPI0012DDCFDC|nr:hypothetical protein [Oscillibacter sp. 1-3]
MKKVKTPKRWIFFRRSALMFPAIHKAGWRQIALTGKKSLAAAHFAIYQTGPKRLRELLLIFCPDHSGIFNGNSAFLLCNYSKKHLLFRIK